MPKDLLRLNAGYLGESLDQFFLIFFIEENGWVTCVMYVYVNVNIQIYTYKYTYIYIYIYAHRFVDISRDGLLELLTC